MFMGTFFIATHLGNFYNIDDLINRSCSCKKKKNEVIKK